MFSILSSSSTLRRFPSSFVRSCTVLTASSSSSFSSISCFSSSSSSSAYEMIQTETPVDGVRLIRLHRPKALNALCGPLCRELVEALQHADADSTIGCIVLTGSEKAFAAGADIKEMLPHSYASVYQTRLFDALDQGVRSVRKPILAAVNGFALGGGCELAMMCDVIYAGENATFGQPEIKLGTIPGIGGTQRLIRAIGKSRAMHLCLTGDLIKIDELISTGLVAKVFPPGELVNEVVSIAKKISSFSKPITALCKEAVNAAEELSLTEGLRLERRLFYSTFATKDRQEGMTAFVEKRNPNFVDE